ncbi:aldo/keto reductase [Desulfitobacterium metallireducens]|uniref:Aldo/keto reductase n=1 Tax=Desulfitobacterium metallireducens DSM 15288 TaxID=871968 RepID=W0E629_9FIRM|nr:aldo/keto reductase [Desulfitobacterium metallireducens]AHF06177.1 aldo/keto reductase [Desulfitobacterium metallireducens DSM 15288]
MLYRKFGKLDFEASILGFGCMRLPIFDGDAGKINEDEAIRMIRYAIDQGINYIDTAYFYHKGQSEFLVGKALQEGYREKVKLATKLPIGRAESYEDFDRLLNEQLSKLSTDHIDFYLLHGLDRESWDKSRKLGVLRFLDQALADGRIRYAGFSFHDDYSVFQEIVDAYSWTFCQIQYNYMDSAYQAGTAGLKYAAAKGLAIIIMEPIKGGKLAKIPPDVIQELWDRSPINRTPAEWALRWVWNHPEVTIVLSGMSTLDQVQENLNTASQSLPGSLISEELALIQKVKERYRSLTKVDCTACGYCQPCPSGVDIPSNFTVYNDAYIYDDLATSRRSYQQFFKEEERASACIECGNCEEACPQHLKIRDYLKAVHHTLGAI